MQTMWTQDVNFIGSEFFNIDEVQKILQKPKRFVNVDNTKLKTTLKREETAWRGTKRVGSLLDDTEDIAR